MPRYDFHCPCCGLRFEEAARVDGPWPPCPKCGTFGEKLFTPTTTFVIPEWMRAEHDRTNDGSNRRWLETPEVQEKLKSGEYRQLGKHEDSAQHF